MSDVTAVPLPPTPRRMLAILWIAVLALIAFGGVAAWRGTAQTVAFKGSPEAYLAWNGKRPGVVTTPSGLEYQILKPGDGKAHPTLSDVVLVNYEGRLRDGKVFDKGEKAPFPLAGIIPGWTEGMQLMTKGARYRFWLPPALAYGEKGAGDAIPPNADLVFDVELLNFIPAEVLRQMQQQQQQQSGGGAPPPGM